MHLGLIKGMLVSLCLVTGFGGSASAATVDPAMGILTYKLSKGNKLVAQFDTEGDVSSWWVVTKPSKKATANSMFRTDPNVGFGVEVASLLEELDPKVLRRNKTQKNAILTRMFGKTPMVLSWTRTEIISGDDVAIDDISPVPLPAGGLLLLTALGATLMLRKKKTV